MYKVVVDHEWQVSPTTSHVLRKMCTLWVTSTMEGWFGGCGTFSLAPVTLSSLALNKSNKTQNCVTKLNLYVCTTQTPAFRSAPPSFSYLPYPSGAGEKCVHAYYLVTGDERLAARTGAMEIGCRFIGSSLQ